MASASYQPGPPQAASLPPQAGKPGPPQVAAGPLQGFAARVLRRQKPGSRRQPGFRSLSAKASAACQSQGLPHPCSQGPPQSASRGLSCCQHGLRMLPKPWAFSAVTFKWATAPCQPGPGHAAKPGSFAGSQGLYSLPARASAACQPGLPQPASSGPPHTGWQPGPLQPARQGLCMLPPKGLSMLPAIGPPQAASHWGTAGFVARVSTGARSPPQPAPGPPHAVPARASAACQTGPPQPASHGFCNASSQAVPKLPPGPVEHPYKDVNTSDIGAV
ncbi:basic proline-rich protein-like [Dendrobium catenatum]|uniref:basic proline-rich protein-like n=1 Tax=Dendrobium catenatum TaxID=906689 RepID=UPI00109F1E2F|nr:basic proline-rich protein-like [Dendrobium catenatum]